MVRKGARVGQKNIVLHLRSEQHNGCSRVGFVVSKAVGPAVVRNLVKRRMRAIMAQELTKLPHGTDVVIRALPRAGRAGFMELRHDISSGLSKYLARADSGKSVR